MRKLVIALVLALISCGSSIPQPCDPEFLAAQLSAMATACRVNAEKTCPGYADMNETEKMACPGVAQCLDDMDRAEANCHGR